MTLILSLSILSCVHVISKEQRDIALKDIPFHQLIRNIDAYLNEVFIFGGIIAETKITDQGTEIEVVQSPLGRFDNIIDEDISEGRFILITKRQLDHLIYRKNREITMAGILTGRLKKMLGDIEYTYPVFEAKEIYLFKEQFYQYPYPYWYSPCYYPSFYYPHDIFWYRPYRYH